MSRKLPPEDDTTLIEKPPHRRRDETVELSVHDRSQFPTSPLDPPNASCPPPDFLSSARSLPVVEQPTTVARLAPKLWSPEDPTLDNMVPPTPRVGPYELVGRFASSPNNDVFLGYKVSPYGFIRRAVVKWVGRQRADYTKQRDILIDEARAIAFVDHPNLVKILDVGEDSHGAYLGIEFVAGTDLRRLNRHMRERSERLPIELSCFIVIQV